MKETVYDFYKGTESIISMYNFAIDYWHNVKPWIKYNGLYKFMFSQLSIVRLVVNSISTTIARTNEIINDLEPGEKKEEYIKKIDSYIDKMPSFSKIESLVKMTKNEKRQKIKNCLAHSNFKIVEIEKEGELTYEILIENDFIKGRLSLNDLYGLKKLYITISDELDLYDTFYSDTWDFFTLSKNNTELLENSIKNIKVCKTKKVLNNLNFQRNFTIFQYNSYKNAEYTFLDDKDVELVKNFIKYIGINSWINLCGNTRSQIFSSYIKFILSNKVDFRRNDDYIFYPINIAVYNATDDLLAQNEIFKYIAPCAYASSILDFGYFCFNYLREANKKEKFIEFRGINLDGIDCFSKYDEPVKYVDESIYLNRLLDEANNKEIKILKIISKIEADKEGLKNAKKLTSEKKEQLELQFNEIIKSRYNDLKQVQFDKVEILKKLSTAEKYYDSSNLIRHLRNSFSHAFYDVDYSKALKTKRLEDIVFTFMDYDIDSENRSNRTLVFETKITAKRLIKLLNEFAKLIDDCVDKKDETYAVIIATSGRDESIEKRVNEIEEEYISQKIKVIRNNNLI